ncbi:MAG: hypothetical protein AB7F75_06780 [Planctomycetota bacterium]
MNGPYNIQYRKHSLERHRLMEKLKVMLVLAMILGFTVLIFSGFSSPVPAHPLEGIPLQPSSSYAGGTAPAWLREYSQVRPATNDRKTEAPKESGLDESRPASPPTVNSSIQRITAIEADRRQLENAIRLAGE